LTRRDSLVRLGGVLVAVAGGGWRLAAADEAAACVLAPETITGVHYIANEPLRQAIAEGKPGAPLVLRAFVVDAATCRPIRNAAVDIWQADALGLYSHGARTFLRGVQRTNGDGLALFRTIYPGWYAGRTAHIHVKVHTGGNVVHSGHLYFPDAVTDSVYRQAPYSGHPGRDTRNATDAYYRSGDGRKSQMSVTRNRAGVYVARITMGVRRA
jgi:protocatechuate 3,4-dioxygenase beta subunit